MKNFNNCQEITILKTLKEKLDIKEQLERIIKNNSVSLRIENIDEESKALLQLNTINARKELKEVEQIIEQVQDRVRIVIAYNDRNYE